MESPSSDRRGSCDSRYSSVVTVVPVVPVVTVKTVVTTVTKKI